MLQRNKVRTDALILTALFLLVGLQPWVLVGLVTYAVYWKERRRTEVPRNAKLRSLTYNATGMKPVPPYYTNVNKYQLLNQPVGSPLEDTTAKSLGSSYYDAIILGTGVDTLYCAALLSRMGYRTICLCPTEDASGCLVAQTNDEWKDIPFDINDSKVANTQAIQKLLAPALCSTNDAQGGVRFASIGTEADGYSYDVISVPGLGYGSVASSFDDGGSSHSDDGSMINKNIANGIPFVLRAGGIASIAQDSALELGDGWFEEGKVDQSTSSIAQYVTMCAELNTDANEYYYSKMLFNEQQAAWASLLSGGKWSSTAYGTAAVRYAGDFLKRFIPYNPQVRSLAAAVGCRNEDILPSQTSMAVHVSNIAAASDPSGFSYPIGGPRSLGHALRHVIEYLGGKVVTEVSVQEFVLEDEETDTNTQQQSKATPPRCVGVKLVDGTILRLKKIKDEEAESIPSNGIVISFLGAIPTCIRIPAAVRDAHGIPTGIPALKERRPLIHLLCGLNGSSLELDLPASDWWRLPSCSLPIKQVWTMLHPRSRKVLGKVKLVRK